jgi:tetratricopeptide (TPR) repeat protein
MMLLRAALTLIAACLAALDGLSQNAAQLIERGDSLMNAGQPQRALASYNDAVKARPDAQAYVSRARARYALYQLDGFILDVEYALRLDSTLPEAHYLRAVYALRGQDAGRAVRHCNSAIAHGATGDLRQKVLLCRGEAQRDRGHDVEALEDLQQALGTDPRDVDGMTIMAELLDRNGRREEALVLLEKLCALEPDQVSHWTSRGYELAMLGRHEEAIKIFDRALAIEKDEPITLSDRAFSLMMLGREEEAMQDVQRSLRFYPGNAFALRTRGILHAHKGRSEEACRDLNFARLLGGVPDIDRLYDQYCPRVKR